MARPPAPIAAMLCVRKMQRSSSPLPATGSARDGLCAGGLSLDIAALLSMQVELRPHAPSERRPTGANVRDDQHTCALVRRFYWGVDRRQRRPARLEQSCGIGAPFHQGSTTARPTGDLVATVKALTGVRRHLSRCGTKNDRKISHRPGILRHGAAREGLGGLNAPDCASWTFGPPHVSGRPAVQRYGAHDDGRRTSA
jgi:hypothetical protein